MIIQKITSEFDVKDITKNWKWKNRIIYFLLGITFTLASLLTYRVYNPVVVRSIKKDKLIENRYDSMCNEYKILTYRDSALTVKNVFEYTKLIGGLKPYETTAQALYETTNFDRIKSSASVNNLYGFKNSIGYIKYNHWTESVNFMVKEYQKNHNLTIDDDYYAWIPKSYHESDRSIYAEGVRYKELALRATLR